MEAKSSLTTFARAGRRGAGREAKVASDPAFVAVRFDVEAAEGDRWSDALLDAGALSVDAADPAAGTPRESAQFGEPAGVAPSWWPVTRLTALFPAGTDAATIMQTTATTLGCAMPVLETCALADRDWVRATQEQFGPIRISDVLWIVPTWCEAPDADALNVVLDPGLAFGTGAHPTTRLCLRWLTRHVTPGASVLDYGCGSGILAIAAAKLGAGHVAGADIDAQAVRASIDNARANAVNVQFAQVDALAPGAFARVVANILANPLRLLAPALAARTLGGGRIALSGILASQAAGVVDAYRRWFIMDDVASGGPWHDGDWVLLSGTRRPGVAAT